MVVAEVPLWVVHSNANAPGSKNGEQIGDAKNSKASESLLLLDGTTTTSTTKTTNGGLQKAAIYSIDVYGNRFATGGGDGTVRIWNAKALFPKPKSFIQSRYKRPVVSSDENETTLGNTLATTAAANKTYESSGESSQDESIPPSSPDSYNANNGNDQQLPTSPVRDLTSVVRRKGEASKQPAKEQRKPQNGVTKTTKTTTTTTTMGSKNNITSKHRLLCTLSAHTGSSVLCVRFSNNGKYLASAGDDAVVCVYAKQESSVGGNNLESNLEHWVRIKLCRGHGLDAVGLAWAPDDSHLVSCSLDSKTPIIVWKLTDLAEESNSKNHNFYNNVLSNPYKILGKGIHTSTVKGVTFDPAGTYLASSGDDPSVCVWRAHDDWGLEQRVDSSSGIFRKWQNDTALSSQSLFRRLSWSTDGAYICATNAVVKNKNVASTISREGWAVSSSKSTATGAVNLVGHKQPVVVACHCPYLLAAAAAAGQPEDSDGEPEYSTLLALGDKRGFVTVWSTRKARPIFKIQCSESRCTVTDLSWGRLPTATKNNHESGDNDDDDDKNRGDLMLLVSLLDGQVVALRFGIPDEFGKLLSDKDQARVFQLRYGIDINDVGRQLFVGDSSGKPKLIENALQFTLEHSHQHTTSDDEQNNPQPDKIRQQANKLSSDEIRKNQLESRKGGKKRIQPLLMQTTALPVAKKPKADKQGQNKPADTLETAMELAEKAASGAAAAAQKTSSQKTSNSTQIAAANSGPSQQPLSQQQQPQHSVAHHDSRSNIQLLAGTQSTPQIPHSTDRIHSVDLPTQERNDQSIRYVADCTNSIRVPKGSSGRALPMSVVSISKGGEKLWNDQLLGSSCCAIAACESWLVVGTSDGCLQVYGTSPTLGWKSASAFRSHPPFVLGRPIVSLHLRQQKANATTNSTTELLVVTSDGNFAVYVLEPNFKLVYKGSLLPAMTHMLLSADLETDLYLPKLARIQITDTDRLLLLLSLQSLSGNRASNNQEGPAPTVGAGGSLQGFIYDKTSELWMRVADSRFVLSDFYKTLPSVSSSSKAQKGELLHLDDSVRMGASSSTLQRSRRSRSAFSTNFSVGDGSANDIASRSHCEDRMACALALNSALEFEEWFAKYVKILAVTGNESLLRMVMDLLLGKYDSDNSNSNSTTACWWLSESPSILGIDRAKLVKTIVIPEMSKNRALQRITNEFAIEAEGI